LVLIYKIPIKRVKRCLNNIFFYNILSYIVVITFIGGGNRSTWRNIPTCETGVHGETYRHVKPEYMEKHTNMWKPEYMEKHTDM
jgi:hypothetical protein